MSDFDKEAEREKLREKYERDQAERQATQRMSDLLLKGATMTNAHCGTCGDPLFQENGTTFCPSCHGNPDAVEGTDLEAQSAEEAAGESAAQSGGQPAPGEAAGESAGQPTDRGAEPTPSSADVASESSAPSESDAAAAEANRQQRGQDVAPTGSQTVDSSTASDPQAAGEPAPDSSSSDRRESTSRSQSSRATVDRSTSSAPSGNADLETARDSLVAALEKFAGKAATTDDPRYAKECLEAAREASETLETLR